MRTTSITSSQVMDPFDKRPRALSIRDDRINLALRSIAAVLRGWHNHGFEKR